MTDPLNTRNIEGQPHLVPLGWAWTSVGDVTMPVNSISTIKAPGTEFLYVDIASIDNSLLRITAPQKLTWEGAPSRARQIILEGDTVFSTVRTYLKNIAQIPKELDGQIASTGFCVLRPATGIDARLIYFLVQSKGFLEPLSQIQRGTSYPAVRDSDVKTQSVLLPPAAEQVRIVAKIEELFSKLDAGVAGLKRTQTLLKRYRQSLLHAAVTGELTRVWREQQGEGLADAADLLNDILAERRCQWQESGKKGRYKEPVVPDVNGLPELPQGWVWASLDQLSKFITSGSRGWADYYADQGATFIRAQDIKTDALKIDNIAYVSLPASTEGMRTRTEVNDLLVTITGANVTKSALVDVDLPEAYVSQHVALTRFVDDSISRFVYLWVITPSTGRRMLEVNAYGLGKPGLNLDHLRELQVALPPLAEQGQIVAEVERRLSILDNMEATVAAELKRADSTRQSILTRAFSGRLVPQDPADEPASVLLERIQAEKLRTGAAAIRGGGGRGRKVRTAAAQPVLLSETAED